jgi:hypothetical protein
VITRGSILFLFLALAASAADLRLVRVWPEWRDGKSFKRISEYFTGRENTGGRIILRTDSAQRTGYYFLVRVENPGAIRTVQAQLHLIPPGSPTQQTTVFPVTLHPGANVLNLGLTTPEWRDAKTQPVAWQLQFIATNSGAVLATEKSYLWDKPAGK